MTGVSDGGMEWGGGPLPGEDGRGAVDRMVFLRVAYATGPNLLCDRREAMRGKRTALDLAAAAAFVAVVGAFAALTDTNFSISC